MEKTASNYRVLLEQELAKWETFKYCLRSNGDKEAFESLEDSARLLTEAGSKAERLLPMETIFMTMLLAQEKQLRHILKELEGLKKQVLSGEKQILASC